MKTRIAFFAAAMIAAGAFVGCTRKTTNASALDISEPTPVYTAPQATSPQPVAQQVIYDTAPAPQYQQASYAPAPSQTAVAGGSSYTVKKGDTLFSIAKARYGNGNQWQRIAQANPGLSPQTLKAGQTIAIP
ncbi:MAG TPA: LysM peptidoglycan-binding domain-containing protein [Tepidisphaeraceae bacterium]|nr:LysM peptidoglycan-binding domain-containing protein [Tepidisphaeraceae bacterium]